MFKIKCISNVAIAFALLALFSCNKTKSDVDTLNDKTTEVISDKELLGIYNFTNTAVEGTFTYNSTGNFASQSFARNNSFGGTFHSTAAMGNFGTVQSGKLVKVGDEIINPNTDNIYQKNLQITDQIWGSSKEISLQASATSPITKTTFRVPKLIEIESYNSLQIGEPKLSVNGTIKVKIDNANNKGVLVTLEYQPAYNDSLRLAGYTQIVRNAEVQNDDGIIELSSKLFNNIPAKCSYKLTIGRTNYQIVESTDGKKYGLYAYLNLSNFYIND